MPESLSHSPHDASHPVPPTKFTLAYVPGATPAKWVRVWRERMSAIALDLLPVEPADVLRVLESGTADVAIARLPLEPEGLSIIPLYEEQPVVVCGREHLLAALDQNETVAVADLDDEIVLHPLDDVLDWEGNDSRVPGRSARERPRTTLDALALVAAGVGVVVVPQSLARLYHRRDVTYRLVEGAPLAPVGLVWRTERASHLTEEFIGIVRGRTANSSRGVAGAGRAGGGAKGGAPRSAAGQQSGSSGKGQASGKGRTSGKGQASGKGRPDRRGGAGGSARQRRRKGRGPQGPHAAR